MAAQTDALVLFLVAVTGFFTLVIFILIFSFAMKYRKEKHPVAADILGSNVLEVTWSIIPFGIFMMMFVWGAIVYMQEVRPPANAM